MSVATRPGRRTDSPRCSGGGAGSGHPHPRREARPAAGRPRGEQLHPEEVVDAQRDALRRHRRRQRGGRPVRRGGRRRGEAAKARGRAKRQPPRQPGAAPAAARGARQNEAGGEHRGRRHQAHQAQRRGPHAGEGVPVGPTAAAATQRVHGGGKDGEGVGGARDEHQYTRADQVDHLRVGARRRAPVAAARHPRRCRRGRPQGCGGGER